MRILITAGPTREKIDAVRFITNYSSGKMGYAITESAVKKGHCVTLISGPVNLSPVAGANVVKVESAAQMREAVLNYLPQMDMIIMAAAVADYRPLHTYAQKMKKSPGNLILELERTVDILAELGQNKQPHQCLVGFAAETEDVEVNALDKLKRKNLDFIVANDVSKKDCGFAVDTNEMTVYKANGENIVLPLATKRIQADRLLEILCKKA